MKENSFSIQDFWLAFLRWVSWRNEDSYNTMFYPSLHALQAIHIIKECCHNIKECQFGIQQKFNWEIKIAHSEIWTEHLVQKQTFKEAHLPIALQQS